jgi:undecaprenyl diphosphate synthase
MTADKDIDALVERLKKSENLPKHVAIIMDGNGRWASQRNLPRLEGHRVGRESVRAVVRACARIGVSYLTLYTFSLENWQRPADEVAGLMLLLEEVLVQEYDELNENGVQLRTIGRLEMLPKSTIKVLDDTRRKLAHNDRLVLTLAMSYSGRSEIVDAAKTIAKEAASGALAPDSLDEGVFAQKLYDPSVPDPDLLIRTSGEQRVSNFMLWQIAYTELYVTDVLWPDFREGQLCDSIIAYQGRDRRFGL